MDRLDHEPLGHKRVFTGRGFSRRAAWLSEWPFFLRNWCWCGLRNCSGGLRLGQTLICTNRGDANDVTG
jgi:hypothetical protein